MMPHPQGYRNHPVAGRSAHDARPWSPRAFREQTNEVARCHRRRGRRGDRLHHMVALTEGAVVVVGSVPVAMGDYDIDPPVGFSVLSIDSNGEMGFQLFFVRS